MKNKTLIYQLIFGAIAGLFIVITTFILYYKGHINSGDIDFTKFGTYGDFIGGLLGTILSIVAVILVYRTYISQKEELSMTRNLLKQQQFENTFFNMLKVHQDLKNNISFDTENLIFREKDMPKSMMGVNAPIKGVLVKGRSFFDLAKNDFEKLFNYFTGNNTNEVICDKVLKLHKQKNYNFLLEPKNLDNQEHKDKILFKYNIFFSNYANYLGDYFRNLYHILNFISINKKDLIDKSSNNKNEIIIKKFKQYSDIVQSQMNFSELFLVYYNSFKFKKLRALIKEFDFVENLHSSNLLDKYHIQFDDQGRIKND